MRRTSLALTAALFLLCSLITPAYAEDGEHVESFDITYAVQTDGSMRVTERIDWQFAPGEHRGIFRVIRTVQDWPVAPEKRRVFEISKIRAFDISDVRDLSDRREPQPIATRQEGNASFIRIGHPDKPFTGPVRRSYLLEYTMSDIVNDRGATAELQLNARLDDPVEARRTQITVVGPTAAIEAVCYQGPAGSTEPCRATAGPTAGPTATFDATRTLGGGDNMTIGAIWPRSSFGDLTPRLEPAGSAAGVGQVTVNPLSSMTWLRLSGCTTSSMGFPMSS